MLPTAPIKFIFIVTCYLLQGLQIIDVTYRSSFTATVTYRSRFKDNTFYIPFQVYSLLIPQGLQLTHRSRLQLQLLTALCLQIIQVTYRSTFTGKVTYLNVYR